jgi:hypothetical protein
MNPFGYSVWDSGSVWILRCGRLGYPNVAFEGGSKLRMRTHFNIPVDFV